MGQATIHGSVDVHTGTPGAVVAQIYHITGTALAEGKPTPCSELSESDDWRFAMTKPFLLRFARPCLSPGRASMDPDYAYDESIDMVRWLGSPDRPPAIEADGPDDPPVTKKADIEKGDDNKDRRMWR